MDARWMEQSIEGLKDGWMDGLKDGWNVKKH